MNQTASDEGEQLSLQQGHQGLANLSLGCCFAGLRPRVQGCHTAVHSSPKSVCEEGKLGASQATPKRQLATCTKT